MSTRASYLVVFRYVFAVTIIAGSAVKAEDVPSCGHPGVPAHGTIDFQSGGKVAYRCERGFFLLGNVIRECNSSTNKWTEELPYCVTDAATGRPVFTSTEAENRTAQMATDNFSDLGILQNDFTCTETDEEHLPWLIVDFLEIHEIIGYNITKLGILPEPSNSSVSKAQEHSLEILIGNSTADFRSNTFCANFEGLSSEETTVLTGFCKEAIVGRYGLLRATRKPVFLPMKLGICKIQFFSTDFIANTQCGSPGQRAFENRCYGIFPNEEISEIGLTWDLANSYCKQTGGKMVGNITENLRNFIAWELAQNAIASSKGPESYWIGLYQETKESDWKTVSGEKITGSLSFWKDKSIKSRREVTDEENETWPYCASVLSEEPKYWTMHSCSDEAGWICSYNVTTCGAPEFPEGISSYRPVLKKYNPGSVVSYKCREDGPSNARTCRHSGLWSVDTPQCDRYNCPTIDPPRNGIMEIMAISQGSTQIPIAQFQCHEGYKIIGNSRLRCLEHGLWNNETPSCSRVMCAYPPLIEHGEFLLSPNETYVGTRLLYSCVSGYTLEGSSILTCLEDGRWNNRWPSCKDFTATLIECSQLDVSNGHVIYLDEGRHRGDRVLVQCDQGYLLRPINAKSVLQCTNSGLWNATLPSCEIGSVILNAPDMHDRRFEIDRGNGNKLGHRLTETNWAMLIAGIVGIALFIAIVGFGTALILSRRRKRRQNMAAVPHEMFTTSAGQSTYVETDSGQFMERTDNPPVSLMYQPLPTVTVENHGETIHHYGSLPHRSTEHFGSIYSQGGQPLFSTSPQFVALGSVDGKPVIYSSLPMKKQHPNNQSLRASTRIELVRRQDHALPVKTTEDINGTRIELVRHENQRNSMKEKVEKSTEAQAYGTLKKDRGWQKRGSIRTRKSPSKRRNSSDKIRLQKTHIVRTSSSSSNQEHSPVQQRRPQQRAESLESLPPPPRRESLESSSTNDSNQESHQSPNFSYYRRSSTLEPKGSIRSRAQDLPNTNSLNRTVSSRSKIRPLSIASSAGVDNEAFSLEEIVIPETLAVQSGYEEDMRNNQNEHFRGMSPASYEGSQDELSGVGNRAREVQNEMLTSPMFQKLKKVHGSHSIEKIYGQRDSDTQESRLPEDPRQSHDDYVGSNRTLTSCRQSQYSDEVQYTPSQRWRVQPRQMPPSPPPPPPPPLQGSSFPIPRLQNRRLSNQEILDEQNHYQTLDSMHPPLSRESSRSTDNIPQYQGHQMASAVPRNLPRNYLIHPRSEDLTENNRRTEYYDQNKEEELPESAAEEHQRREQSERAQYASENSDVSYPPPARFFPADSWKLQQNNGRRTPTVGLRRVSLPKEEMPYDDGVRAVYFNDAASPETKSSECITDLTKLRNKDSSGGRGTPQPAGVYADVSNSEGDEELRHGLSQRTSNRHDREQENAVRRPNQTNRKDRHDRHRGGRRFSDDRPIDQTVSEKPWNHHPSRAEAGNVLLDDRALQDLLESVNFELDRNFVEPVELRSYAASKRHQGGSRETTSRHQADRVVKRGPKAAPRGSLLRVGNDESDSSPRLSSHQMARSKARASASTPVPSNTESASSHGHSTHSTMWDAKKFKHRHKKVQFSDAVDEYMLSVADRSKEGTNGNIRPPVITETYSNPSDRKI